MKTRALVIAVALSMGASVALAQQGHQAHHSAAMPRAGMAASTTPTPMMPRMEQRLEEMQALVEKLSQTESPAERRKLMEEHRQKMHETKTMMRGMGSGMGMGMGMMGGGPDMMPMMERMQEMRADMDKILQTEDPAERRKLMEEHRRKMHETMSMMSGMQGCQGMMGGGMQPGMMEAYQQMNKRLDMMQKLLEHLLEGQQ